MYYDYFGLHHPPYKITPDTEAFYAGANRGAVLDALVYAVCNGEGITKVVGEVGSGKTMLCRVLEAKLPDNVDIVYLANPSLSPDNILHAIAFEIGLPVTGDTDRLHVMKALQEYLLAKHSNNRQVVVFVEEAQAMPLETLEEIRLLTNLETKHHKLLQLVLFGQPELDTALAAPHVRQLRERITHSFYLPALTAAEIRDYLMFRLNAAGYRGADIFSHGAIRRIARASGGLMRRINILADKAMLAAYAGRHRTIARKHVQAAIRDSEFITRRWQWQPLWLAAPTAVAAVIVAIVWDKPADARPPAMATATLETPRPANPQRQPVLPPRDATITDAPLDQRFATTQAWLTDANPDHYTIQLSLGSADEMSWLERFLSQDDIIALRDDIHIYHADIRGQHRISVVYGDFRSFSDAETALASLPERLRRDQPFLRNIRQILAETRPVQTAAPHAPQPDRPHDRNG